MSYLRYCCLFTYSGACSTHCVVFFVLFFLCTLCCQFLWIVHSSYPFRFFSNVYSNTQTFIKQTIADRKTLDIDK
jgi:hypothetical protein